VRKVLIVGEDRLCCTLGSRLVKECLPDWEAASDPIDAGGITGLLKALRRYAAQARNVQPVLCIADTDRRCTRDILQKHLPKEAPPGFLWRLAVPEAESWVLADRAMFAEYFRVPKDKIPTVTDNIFDPKRLILNLVQRSKERRFRNEMVSERDPSKPGTGYNLHLSQFVAQAWRVEEARLTSESLQRAHTSLERLAQQGKETP